MKTGVGAQIYGMPTPPPAVQAAAAAAAAGGASPVHAKNEGAHNV